MTASRQPDTIQSVAIDQIDVGERLRAHREDVIPDLVASITTLGLLHPIALIRAGERFRLVAGRHRFEACRQLGWADIPAIILDVDALAAELREVDENLVRAELTVLERGEHLVRRAEILDALGQRAKSGRPKKSVTVTDFVTTADLASMAGVSVRTAQRDMSVAGKLPSSVRDLIRSTALADQTWQLHELAAIEDQAEQLAVAQLFADGVETTVEYARLRIDVEARRCPTCQQVVDPIELVEGKVVHGPGCGSGYVDEDLKPPADGELIDLTPTMVTSEEPSPLAHGAEQVLAQPRQPAELIALVFGIVGAFPLESATELVGELRDIPLPLNQDEVETLCRHLEEARTAATDLEAAIRAAASPAAPDTD
jgi:ParB/RepB/Spo0J family partition protein